MDYPSFTQLNSIKFNNGMLDYSEPEDQPELSTAPPQKPIPPGVGEASRRWRPWIWLAIPIDFVAILFLLVRFLYAYTVSGWAMDGLTGKLIQIAFLLVTFVLLTCQLIIALCLFISLVLQSDGWKTVRYSKMWMCCSHLVNFYIAVVATGLVILKREQLLFLLLTAGILVFRLLALAFVRVFSKILTHEIQVWETRLLQESQNEKAIAGQANSSQWAGDDKGFRL